MEWMTLVSSALLILNLPQIYFYILNDLKILKTKQEVKEG